jgi:hypothetical protein
MFHYRTYAIITSSDIRIHFASANDLMISRFEMEIGLSIFSGYFGKF